MFRRHVTKNRVLITLVILVICSGFYAVYQAYLSSRIESALRHNWHSISVPPGTYYVKVNTGETLKAAATLDAFVDNRYSLRSILHPNNMFHAGITAENEIASWLFKEGDTARIEVRDRPPGNNADHVMRFILQTANGEEHNLKVTLQ